MDLCFGFLYVWVHFPNDNLDTFNYLWSHAIIYYLANQGKYLTLQKGTYFAIFCPI